jgi:hypothetical protein
MNRREFLRQASFGVGAFLAAPVIGSLPCKAGDLERHETLRFTDTQLVLAQASGVIPMLELGNAVPGDSSLASAGQLLDMRLLEEYADLGSVDSGGEGAAVQSVLDCASRAHFDTYPLFEQLCSDLGSGLQNGTPFALDFEESPGSVGGDTARSASGIAAAQAWSGGASGQAAVSPDLFRSVTYRGWRAQVRGMDNHPLGSCVSQSVRHVNLELFRQDQRGKYRHVVNLHLGAYRDGRRKCLVLYNSTNPRVCWRICNPTRSDLQRMLVWALYAAAAIACVVIAAQVASAIAAVLASILFVPLLLI